MKTIFNKIPPSERQVLLASTNRGKYSELKPAFDQRGILLLSAQQVSNPEPYPEVEEDLPDYLGNAEKKARAYAAWSKLITLADDTGLEVEGLRGAPGIYSARFAGPNAEPQQNRTKLLEALKDPRLSRYARFVCVLVLVSPAGGRIVGRGELRGRIAASERGSGGFGYDSIFEVADSGKTLAEFKGSDLPVKTHRLAALEDLIRQLEVTPAV